MENFIELITVIYAVSVCILLLANMSFIVGSLCKDDDAKQVEEASVAILKITNHKKPKMLELINKHPHEMFWMCWFFGVFFPVINTLSVYNVYKFLTLSKKQ